MLANLQVNKKNKKNEANQSAKGLPAQEIATVNYTVNIVSLSIRIRSEYSTVMRRLFSLLAVCTAFATTAQGMTSPLQLPSPCRHSRFRSTPLHAGILARIFHKPPPERWLEAGFSQSEHLKSVPTGALLVADSIRCEISGQDAGQEGAGDCRLRT